MAENWYALRVKPHKERAVCQLLESQEIALYFPMVQVKPKNPRSAKLKPYFPGYMFLKADLDELGHNAFSWIPGTLGLVSFGDLPAIVPNTLIVELQKKLETINTLQSEKLNLKKGERIKITEGPFAGFEAIFDMQLPGSDRVQILLAFLSSHPHPLRLPQNAVEKVEKR